MVNPALLTLFFKYLTSAQLFFWQVANFSKLMKTMVPWPGSKSSLRIASKMESSNFQSRLDPFFSLLDKFISSSGSQPTAVGIKQFKNRYKAATQRICCSDPKVYMRPVLWVAALYLFLNCSFQTSCHIPFLHFQKAYTGRLNQDMLIKNTH